MSVCRETCACYFGINFCTACQSMFQLFEDQTGCSFSDNEAVAALTERTGSGLWRIVACRERIHGVETSHPHNGDGGFGTSGYDRIGFAQTDIVERIGNGVCRRGTCRDRGKVGASETIFHRDMTGRYICDNLKDKERIKTWPTTQIGRASCRERV